MRIRDKIKKPQRPVVAYEILPPREKDGTLNAYAETISSLLSQTHIDAINIPEVHDEVARGERPVSNQERGVLNNLTSYDLSKIKIHNAENKEKFDIAIFDSFVISGIFSRVPVTHAGNSLNEFVLGLSALSNVPISTS